MRTTQPDGHPPGTPSTSPHADLKRRRFLVAMGAGSAAAAAAATQAIAAPAQDQAAGAAPGVSQGYHETDHIRDYYATTRL